jgi:hypothetical protein
MEIRVRISRRAGSEWSRGRERSRRKRFIPGFPIAATDPPPHNLHMGSKKNRVKKVFTPSPAAPTPNHHTIDDNDNDNLVDELLTELDSRNETTQRESATVLEEIQTRQQSEAEQAAALDKAGSKNRFKARQVRSVHHTHSSRVTSLSSRQGKPQLSLICNHPSTPRQMQSWSEKPRMRSARLTGYVTS